MSTITLKIDTEHLDYRAVQDIYSILHRAVGGASNERLGFAPVYPFEILGEELVGGQDGHSARFGFDKNKPKL